MGSAIAESLRGSKSLSLAIANTFKSRTRATTHPLHPHHTLSSQALVIEKEIAKNDKAPADHSVMASLVMGH
jgi:hypothetical protein